MIRVVQKRKRNAWRGGDEERCVPANVLGKCVEYQESNPALANRVKASLTLPDEEIYPVLVVTCPAEGGGVHRNRQIVLNRRYWSLTRRVLGFITGVPRS